MSPSKHFKRSLSRVSVQLISLNKRLPAYSHHSSSSIVRRFLLSRLEIYSILQVVSDTKPADLDIRNIILSQFARINFLAKSSLEITVDVGYDRWEAGFARYDYIVLSLMRAPLGGILTKTCLVVAVPSVGSSIAWTHSVCAIFFMWGFCIVIMWLPVLVSSVEHS